MFRRLGVLLALALIAGPLIGCQKEEPKAVFDQSLAQNFFPLAINSVWTYQVKSKSQRQTYIITDRVVGVKYVPSLNVTGNVVEEFYNLDRGGTRPIVYLTKNGYLTRLSGLDYKMDAIEAPAWGRSEDGMFLPERLTPNLAWNNTIFPFGHMAGSFDIKQSHRSFFEAGDVVVPAGHFANCMRIETLAHYEGGSYAKVKGKMDLTYEDWYAPHVGLIKTVALEGGPKGPEMERVELIRFNVPQSQAGTAGSSKANTQPK